MKNTIIYFEFSRGSKQYHELTDFLLKLTERKVLDGFFTLTMGIRSVKQPSNRPDLAQLSEDLAVALGGKE